MNAAAQASKKPLLRVGDSGEAVERLQGGLRQMADSGVGRPVTFIPNDGDFGSDADFAVKAYQIHLGLVGDGIVGDLTWWTPGRSGKRLFDRAILVL